MSTLSKNATFISFIMLMFFCFHLEYCNSLNFFRKTANFLQQAANTNPANITDVNDLNYIIHAIGTCNSTTCVHGKCEDDNTCDCTLGYGQLPSDTTTLCNYKLKEQLLAFILETVFIFGVGHFYIGQVFFGLMKILAIALIVIMDCLFKSIWKSDKLKNQNCVNAISYVMYFGLVFFQLFDVVMFGLNKYKDGNGMPLYVQ